MKLFEYKIWQKLINIRTWKDISFWNIRWENKQDAILNLEKKYNLKLSNKSKIWYYVFTITQILDLDKYNEKLLKYRICKSCWEKFSYFENNIFPKWEFDFIDICSEYCMGNEYKKVQKRWLIDYWHKNYFWLVYRIYNKNNNKSYVWQTKQSFIWRWGSHIYWNWNVMKNNNLIDLCFEVLEIIYLWNNLSDDFLQQKLNEREHFYIKKFDCVKNWFNKYY